MNFIKLIYSNKIFAKTFHTLVSCLQDELSNCETVLDLGCGPNSPIQFCKNIKNSVGVETFRPYLDQSKRKHIHTKYLQKKIEKINFPSKSFDAVILIEVIEHLSPKEGLKMIKKAEQWAKKKVIISSPNGFLPQHIIDNNPYQKHLSGWDYQKMKNLGYKIHGLAGFKIFRQQVKCNTMGENLLVSIRFWPKPFWFIIAAISQLVNYHFPQSSFELFSVKNINT